MTRIERRLLVRNSMLGVLLTLVVLLADWRGKDGLLAKVENNLYDLRARQCQFFTPPPTDKLVHIDIDDPSLQFMGQWPWSRRMMAELTDTMRDAGTKAVAFDVLFAEAERPDTIPTTVTVVEKRDGPGAEAAVTKPMEVLVAVDGNALFAASLRRFGNAILPASYTARVPGTALGQAMYEALYEDLLRNEDEVRQIIAVKGHMTADLNEFRTSFAKARKDAIFDRIIRLLDTMNPGTVEPGEATARTTIATGGSDPGGRDHGAPASLKIPTEREVIEKLFPGKELRMQRDFPPGLFRPQFERAVAFRNLRRFARQVPAGLPPFVPAAPELPPIPALSDAIRATAFVDYLSDGDGVVRAVELWRDCEGWLYPQMGLMLACAYLNVDIHAIEIYDNRIVIPKPDGTRLTVPVFSQYVGPVRQTCGMYMPVPWFGPFDRDDAYTRIYDYPRYVDTTARLPMLKVWEVLEFRNKNRRNIAEMHNAIGRILSITDRSRFDRFEKMELDVDDAESRIKLADDILSRPEDIEFQLQGAEKLSETELEEWLKAIPEEERAKMGAAARAARALPSLRQTTADIAVTLAKVRDNLHKLLNDKAVLIGFTAIGRLDVVPTSLFPRCPGVVVHGVVFNALLTGDVWTRASPWITRLATLFVGLLATAIVAYFHPFNALLSSLTLAGGYLLFNGVYLFDYHNYIVGAAAPLVSIGVVWSGCTLLRFIVERAERRHIENRFRSYVDPALVNAIIEHPEKVHFEGESREMTVVFTDLAGFTTLSEKLKERTVPILNEYMRRMVMIIRNNKQPEHRRGYRNKFLGDGIMFFFGAPLDNNLHAVDAVATVLRMQEAMPAFNDWLKAQDLPPVKMRAGISTGLMIVGDAGSPDAADYTVLGDDVNFGARLESANKAIGTLVMMSQRTREFCGDLFLARPVAKLQVVGKTTGIRVYEPICYMEDATAEQKKLAAMTEAMMETFTRGDFAGCLEHTRAIDEAFGASKLTALYRRQCENYQAEPPGADFDGTIVLSEK